MAESVRSDFSLENVLMLLDKIKTSFAKDPQKFTTFKDIWTSYLNNEISGGQVLQRFGKLFRGNVELMSAFNALLPPGYRLGDDLQLSFGLPKSEIANESEHQSSDHTMESFEIKTDFEVGDAVNSDDSQDTASDCFDQCLQFMDRIQSSFGDKPEVMQKFLDILQSYLATSCKNSSDDSKLMMENTLKQLDTLLADDSELAMELKDFVLGSHDKFMHSDRSEPDDSTVDIVKYGTYKEFAFFDEVRRQMGNEETYVNFMHCLQLYASNMISGFELLNAIEPFVVKSPELMRQLKEMIQHGNDEFESVPLKTLKCRKTQHPDVAMEIDYFSSKKQGVSYRALPASFEKPVCSARTELCNEVLNDTWVSFPLWSEDTTFGNSKITAYQEFLYRCEDERFELQIVIDSVSDTIKILESVYEKMEAMLPDERTNFTLDDRLGGTSEVLQKRSIQRIYGDRANQIIDGLKKNPFIAVPIALRRLKAKTQEWKEHQERFNNSWKELNVKNYQKSLYNEASTYKQNDQKDTKTKNLLQEAEALYYENQAQTILGISKVRGQQLIYPDKMILYDASVLMNHYLSHMPTVQNDDGFLISKLLVEFFPSLIYIPGTEIADGGSQRKASVNSTPELESYTLMYTTSDWYLFVRLHHKLCERLLDIRTRCQQMLKLGYSRSDLITPQGKKAGNPYEFVLLMTECLVEGIVDNSAFEDQLRSVFEVSACSMFALDKLLHNIMKQLQHITSDELNKELMVLFENAKANGGTGGGLNTSHQRSLQEMSYWHSAFEMLSDECYKIVFYKYKGLVTIELMYKERPQTCCFGEVKLWADYIDQYTASDADKTELVQKQLFLKRNIQEHRLDALNHHLQGQKSPIVTVDNMQCQFNMNSLKMVYTVNSWDFFQFHSSVRKRFSESKSLMHKRKKFLKWWSGWKHSNVSNEQERRFREWLTGHKTSRVRSRQQYEHSVTPYRQCKKFSGEKRS